MPNATATKLNGTKYVVLASADAPGLDKDGYLNKRYESLAVIDPTDATVDEIMQRLDITRPSWATGVRLVKCNGDHVAAYTVAERNAALAAIAAQ